MLIQPRIRAEPELLALRHHQCTLFHSLCLLVGTRTILGATVGLGCCGGQAQRLRVTAQLPGLPSFDGSVEHSPPLGPLPQQLTFARNQCTFPVK
jgi:hypothetical protein